MLLRSRRTSRPSPSQNDQHTRQAHFFSRISRGISYWMLLAGDVMDLAVRTEAGMLEGRRGGLAFELELTLRGIPFEPDSLALLLYSSDRPLSTS